MNRDSIDKRHSRSQSLIYKKLKHAQSAAAGNESMSMSRESREPSAYEGWEVGLMSTNNDDEGNPLMFQRRPCRKTGLAEAFDSHHVFARGSRLATGADVRRRLKRYHKEQISKDERREAHRSKADTLLPRTRRCSTTCLGSTTDAPEQRQPL